MCWPVISCLPSVTDVTVACVLKSVEAEVVMVVTEVAATEVVEEDTVAETVVVAAMEAVDLEGATKWEEGGFNRNKLFFFLVFYDWMIRASTSLLIDESARSILCHVISLFAEHWLFPGFPT